MDRLLSMAKLVFGLGTLQVRCLLVSWFFRYRWRNTLFTQQ